MGSELNLCAAESNEASEWELNLDTTHCSLFIYTLTLFLLKLSRSHDRTKVAYMKSTQHLLLLETQKQK